MQSYHGLNFKREEGDVLLINKDDRWWALDMRSSTINNQPINVIWVGTHFTVRVKDDKFTFFSPEGKRLVSYGR